MKKFEYLCVNDVRQKDLQVALNENGSIGWELIGFDSYHYGTTIYHLVFKREIAK